MYNHKEIEKKWQEVWEKTNPYKTTDKYDKKFYALDMFPYPSGSGLHVGHPEGYTATDIISRYKRLNKFDVLHPIGWDAFGLPAEQYALNTGHHPWAFTVENINVFRKQLKSLGFSFDYSKEVNTADPDYYKWTQWIFKKIYEMGLAEQRFEEVNWCPGLGCVLANEEVIENDKGEKVSEVGKFPVEKKLMKQWVLKITNYADRLLEDLDELDWPESLKKMQINWIGKEIKDGKVTYHLRDWLFARQRYWGEPFPLYFDENNNVYLAEEELVELPYMENIKSPGTGEGPLATNTEWINFEKNGKKYRRDSNIMPQWAGSSWYYLAYIMKNEDGSYTPLDSKEAYERFEKWLPVDLYIGGQEHAVLHLLYARFWHKVLYDAKIVPTKEPFQRLVNQGMILGTDNQKMSKSIGNVINPDEIVNEFGADTLRIYEMFMGPLTDTKAWNTETVQSTNKWITRVINLFQDFIQNNKFDSKHYSEEFESDYNYFLKESTLLIEGLKFNILISKMMVFINLLYKQDKLRSKESLKNFAIILSLLAPHIAEELLEMLGEKQMMHQEWPTFDESKIIEQDTIIAIQVNGKLRSTIILDKSWNKDKIIEEAKKDTNVSKYLEHKKISDIIYIDKKVLNFIVE